jgi:hypothetical protein
MNGQIRELSVDEVALIAGGADPHWHLEVGPIKVQGNAETGEWSLWNGNRLVGTNPDK